MERKGKKIRIVCKCEQNAFIQKYKKELEVLFHTKYKLTTPMSEESLGEEDDNRSSTIFFQDYSDTSENRQTFVPSNADVLLTTPVDSTQSMQSKSLEALISSEKLDPTVEEKYDDKLSKESNVSDASLPTNTIVTIKEKRSSTLEYQIEANKSHMEKLMRIIEHNIERVSSINEEKLRESLTERIESVSHIFKKIKKDKSQLEADKTIEIVKGMNRAPFDITEQAFQIQNLLERIEEILQSIQDNQILNIMNYISQLKGEASSKMKESTTKLKESSVFLPPPCVDAVSLPSYSETEAEVEEEDEERLISARDEYLRAYRYWIKSRQFEKEDSEAQEDYSFTGFFEPDDLSTPMKRAEYYLKSRNIYMFFRFLGAHLVAASPENPIDFLIDLLEKCCDYRVGICMPPLLFELRHVESLYYSLDKMGTGEITLDQYFTGLLTLGLANVSSNPKLNNHFMVNRETFINDACKLLTAQFESMIRIPGESTLQPLTSKTSSRISLARSG